MVNFLSAFAKQVQNIWFYIRAGYFYIQITDITMTYSTDS